MPTQPLTRHSTMYTAILAAVAGLGAVLSFISTIVAFVGIEDVGKGGKLVGADNELGFPSSAFAILLFTVVLAIAVAQLAGADLGSGWWSALLPIGILGVAFEAWVLYLHFTPLVLVQLLLIIAQIALVMPRVDRHQHTVIGTWLIVGGVTGFFAAFRLTVDKVGTVLTPGVDPSCNYSVLVQCGKNLVSWQGSLFGFPNPFIGIGGWIAVVMVGIMLLAGLHFARWFWIVFNAGIILAMAFICWLIYESIFQLGTLCPWCMTTWVVLIPTFWLVTLRNLKHGVWSRSAGATRVGSVLYGIVPLITLLSYIVVLIVAQVGLDLLSYL